MQKFPVTNLDVLSAVKVMLTNVDVEDYPGDAVRWGLESLGFEATHGGFYSSVFTHPDMDFVVKVNNRPDIYPVFVQYCIQCADDPELSSVLPKILYYRSIGAGYVCILPKYYDLKPGSSARFSDLDYKTRCQLSNILDVTTGRQFFNDAAEELANDLDIDNDEAFQLIYRVGCAEYDTIRTAARIMYETLEPVCTFDMHNGNFMLDADGRLVITDPVSAPSGMCGGDTAPSDVSGSVEEYSAPEIDGGAE